MLDLTFYKGPRCRTSAILDHRAFVKPTARHIPLSSLSAHPPAVHRGWPVAEMSRLHRLCSSPFNSVLSRERCINRFRRFFLDPAVISRCSEWSPTILRAPKPNRVMTFRLVVRWHPCLAGLESRLNDVCRLWEPYVARVWGRHGQALNLRVQVAWCSAAAPLHVVLRNRRF